MCLTLETIFNLFYKIQNYFALGYKSKELEKWIFVICDIIEKCLAKEQREREKKNGEMISSSVNTEGQC